MQNRDGEISRQRMADRIGFVMSHHTERERILRWSARLGQQAGHEVAGADVMEQVAEVSIAERKISEVLDVRAGPRIGSRVIEILIGRLGKSLANHRPELTLPGLIDQRLMRQDGERAGGCWNNQQRRNQNRSCELW